MPAVLPDDQNVIRSGPSVLFYYLAIVPRTVVLGCSLNKAAATWGETLLPYDDVTHGAYSDVEAGQTLLVYDAFGTYKAKVRVRAINASTIKVAANDDIEWADDDLLRVVDVFEPWARPTNMEDTAGGIVYYKDTDIAWSSNAVAFPPQANAGAGFAGFIDGGYADVPFPGSLSYALAGGATLSTWSWDIDDGAFAVGNASSQDITARFSTPGFRWVKLTVTDSNGVSDVNRQPVWTFGGSYQPIVDFEIRRRGYEVEGGELVVEVSGDAADENTIYDGARVCLFTREYIDGVEVTADVGSYFAGRRQVRFDGWIQKGSINWNPETGRVTFTVVSLRKMADQLEGYPTFIEDVDSGSEDGWHTGVGLTVRNTIMFLLKWHSNLTQLAHFEIEPSELIAGRKFFKASPLTQVANAFLMERGVFAMLGCSRWGSVHVRYDPQIESTAGRAAVATVLNLTNEDWLTELDFEKAHDPRLAALLGGGIAYDGADGTPYRGRAPGKVGRRSGRHERADNLIIADQTDLNEKLGRLLGKKSSPWSPVSIELWWDVFEPALQEYVTLTVSEDENPRGISFDTGTKWVVRRCEIEDTPGGTPRVRIEVEWLSDEFEGVTVEIPNPPTIPVPEDPSEIPPPIPTSAGGKLGVFGNGGFAYTLNAFDAVKSYNDHDTGLGDATFVKEGCIDPGDYTQAACIDNTGEVYTTTDVWGGANWSLALSIAAAEALIDAKTGVAPVSGQTGFVGLKGFTDGVDTYLLVVVRFKPTGASFFQSRVLRSDDWGATWACGGEIPGYDLSDKLGVSIDCSWYILDKDTPGVQGLGELAYDGDEYLYIAANTPDLGGTGRSTFNRSPDWGETWMTVAEVEDATGGSTSAETREGPCCAECAPNGKLYMVPWKASPDRSGRDDGGLDAYYEKGNNYCCGSTYTVDERGTLSIPEDGDYEYYADCALLSVGTCPNDGAYDCTQAGAQAARMTLRVDYAAGGFGFIFSNVAGPQSGTIALLQGDVLTLSVSLSIAGTLCCGAAASADGMVSGPVGAPVIGEGELEIVSGFKPYREEDLVSEATIDENDGVARYRGMLSTSALSSYMILQVIGTLTPVTYVYRNGTQAVMLDRIYRTVKCDPFADDIVYFGRSWIDGERASPSYPIIVLLSTDGGLSTVDITGDISLTGVTGIIVGEET